METIGSFQAKTHFSALLERVEKGEEVIITKHGRPVAKLIPTAVISSQHTKQTIQHIKEFGARHKLQGLDWKTLRDEGRP